MAHLDLPTPAVIGVLALTVLYGFLRRYRRSDLPLPPGPSTSWFNAVKLPKSYQWRVYAQWRDTYGDMIYTRPYGNPVLVLNSAEVCQELLERRSNIYSSRPIRTMVNELMGFTWLLSSVPYGPWWRKHRSLMHRSFQPNLMPRYHPVLLRESHTLLRNLLTDTKRFMHHARTASAAIVMDIAYGHKIAPEGDVFVTLADETVSGLSVAGIWGTFMVDYFPSLKHYPAWLPGGGFQHAAKRWRDLSQEMLNRPYAMVKEKMASGTAVPCLASWALEEQQQAGSVDEAVIKNVAATAYAAGADTTASTIQAFILAMAREPAVQARAQAELDGVLGDRLPTFADRDALPFVSCIVWEALRWNPVTPFGLAHCVTADDEYAGFRIPRGTTVIPNVWGILHEPKRYPDPLRFDPARFEDEEKNRAADVNPLPEQAFGFGRRVCPGRHFAFDTVWIVVASILATYDIAPVKDEQGRPLVPPPDFTSTSLSRPMPFEADIRPRSNRAADLVRQTAEE